MTELKRCHSLIEMLLYFQDIPYICLLMCDASLATRIAISIRHRNNNISDHEQNNRQKLAKIGQNRSKWSQKGTYGLISRTNGPESLCRCRNMLILIHHTRKTTETAQKWAENAKRPKNCLIWSLLGTFSKTEDMDSVSQRGGRGRRGSNFRKRINLAGSVGRDGRLSTPNGPLLPHKSTITETSKNRKRNRSPQNRR